MIITVLWLILVYMIIFSGPAAQMRTLHCHNCRIVWEVYAPANKKIFCDRCGHEL